MIDDRKSKRSDCGYIYVYVHVYVICIRNRRHNNSPRTSLGKESTRTWHPLYPEGKSPALLFLTPSVPSSSLVWLKKETDRRRVREKKKTQTLTLQFIVAHLEALPSLFVYVDLDLYRFSHRSQSTWFKLEGRRIDKSMNNCMDFFIVQCRIDWFDWKCSWKVNWWDDLEDGSSRWRVWVLSLDD